MILALFVLACAGTNETTFPEQYAEALCSYQDQCSRDDFLAIALSAAAAAAPVSSTWPASASVAVARRVPRGEEAPAARAIPRAAAF